MQLIAVNTIVYSIFGL